MTAEDRGLVTERVLIALLLFQAVSALLGGLTLVFDPSGAALVLTLDLLGESPFGSYRLPGLILLSVLGLVPCFVAVGIGTGRSWGAAGAVFVGSSLVLWIVVQVAMIGYQPWPPPPWPSLQIVYGAVGLAILALGVGVAARRHP